MASAAIAFANLADTAALTPSSEEVTLPASNLQQPDIARRWRSIESGGAFIVADLGAAASIDTIALIGTTMSVTGTARLRISATDSAGEAGELYDSGAIIVDDDYNQAVFLLPSPVAGRYVRIDLADAGADYVEAGRLFVGLRSQIAVNFDYGWSVTTGDRSTASKSRGGQTLVWPDQIYRILDVTFNWLSVSERYGVIETIERQNALKKDVLFILDPESAFLARDAIWGLMTTSTPMVNPFLDRFSKQYKIEERL